ncbi:MAG TPA: hypothetical protein VJP78_00545 [Thermoleophilia bacterium]|nr:hypothetical protein [Thermoleophilia bacterium]
MPNNREEHETAGAASRVFERGDLRQQLRDREEAIELVIRPGSLRKSEYFYHVPSD